VPRIEQPIFEHASTGDGRALNGTLMGHRTASRRVMELGCLDLCYGRPRPTLAQANANWGLWFRARDYGPFVGTRDAHVFVLVAFRVIS
jgi:hypothetical protein